MFSVALGGVPLTVAQQNLVNGAAISACDVVGGEHLGYLTDPLSCKYDPRKDAAVLCSGTTIGGVIGTNTTAACVNGAQATAMVKFWYGPTTDGSVPDPAVDNGTAPTLSGQRIAHGIARGTNTVPANFFGIGLDTLALALQDPTYGTADLKNPTGSGLNRWKSWDYGAFASAVNQSLTMQPFFADYDTNKTDLSAAKAAGVKIIHYHGLADSLISPMNSVNYYTAMQAKMGGYATTQSFNRMFLIPKQDHCNIDLGGVAGAAGPAVSMAQGNVPLPGGAALLDTSTGANRTVPGSGQLYKALTDWVENKTAPTSLTLTSADGTRSQPVCMHPLKATYNGSGDVKVASSWTCK